MERDYGFSHIRVSSQSRFDFFDFDPETADLDLIVDSAQIFDIAIGQEPSQIAGPVQTVAAGFDPPIDRSASERVGNEFLGSQFRAIEISPGEADPSDVEFARDADGAGLQIRVENIDLRIGDRPSYRHRPLDGGLLAAPESDVNCSLGRAVEIVQLGSQTFEESFLQFCRQRFSAAKHLSEGAATLHAGPLPGKLEALTGQNAMW